MIKKYPFKTLPLWKRASAGVLFALAAAVFAPLTGHAQYCVPEMGSDGCADGDNVNTFVLNGENGTSFNDQETGCAPDGIYDDRSSQPAVDLSMGVTYNPLISSEYNLFGIDGDLCAIWIDFNDDEVFSSSEMVAVYDQFLELDGSMVPLTIPLGVPLGNHRMRVMVGYPNTATAADFDPCNQGNTMDYLEVHDYTVNILNPPTCLQPTALNTSGITPTTATLGWTEAGTATQWQVEYGPDGFTLGTGTMATVNTTPSYDIVSGLGNGGNFQFYVRAICSVSDQSSWTGPYAFAVPVSNGDCSTATELTSTLICSPVTASTVGTTGGDMASCAAENNGNAWFSFVATGPAERVSIDNITLSGNAIEYYYGAAVYSGDCDALSEVDCQADGGFFGGGPLEINLSGLNVGETYYVQMWEDGAYDIDFNPVPADYTFDICVTELPDVPSSCATLLSPADGATGIVVNPYPTFTWNAVPGATGYTFFVGETAATASEITDVTDTTVTISGMDYSTTYYWYVVPFNNGGDAVGCDANVISFTTEDVPPPPANDNATGAIALIMGAPCSGAVYTNVSATLNSTDGEPYPSCNTNSAGEHSVWFSFTAPASGSVKITTDNGSAGSLSDTKIGLFSATDPSDYSSFTLVACDDDNGIDNDTTDFLSTIFTTGLTGGATYYVEVDGYSDNDEGTFCLQVQEINPTMLNSSASCADLQSPLGNESTYTGWVTLLDGAGKLVALVRNPAGGEASAYEGSYNIDGNGFGMPRQDANGVYYLSRNYMINNPDISTPVDVQFFFHPGEIATLTGVTAGATTLSNLNVTKQESTTCNANFAQSNGATSVLLQTANGQVNGVSWIQVSTSSFSNFYLMGGTAPLFVELKNISATNEGSRNRVDWTTAKEDKGDFFELQRSADGRQFSFLATVAAKGQPSGYTYYDNSPLQGVTYYRLKMADAEGKAVYSAVVSATVGLQAGFDLQAYPNPATSGLSVEIAGTRGADAALTISDATGRVLRTIPVTDSKVNVDMSSLSQGFYLIEYRDAQNHKTIRVGKQ